MQRNVSQEKRELRSRIRALRETLREDERARMAAAASGLLVSLPEIRRARTILLFYAFGTEPATLGVIESLRAEGKRVLLPRMAGGRIEAADGATPLRESGYGPREPTGPSLDPAEIEAVVVPGMAFDRQGNRLGRGRGHYDRFLADLPSDVPRIGILFSQDLLDEVPVEAGDEPVDILVTDREVVRPRRGG